MAQVIVVDDEAGILNSVKRLLRRHDIEVDTSLSGQEALLKFEEQAYQLIISDMRMPNMGGSELLSVVSQRWPDTIRICLTGYSDVEDTVSAINDAGIYRYISKPWDDMELVEAVKSGLEKYSKRADTAKKNAGIAQQNIQLKEDIESQQRELEQKQSELEDANKQTEESRQAQQQAEQLSEAKGRFLASMSHEMRTPLNAIISMNALLLESNLSDEQRDLAKLAHDGGQSLLALINDILDFSKIDSGKLSLHEEWFSVQSVLESVIELCSSQAMNKSIELVNVISPGAPTEVYGDKTRFQQILMNIVSNATKFTEHGGVIVKTSASKSGVQISVKDTGIGIRKSDQALIFSEFFQSEKGEGKSYGGTGLGLAICHKLVKMMNGYITLKSEENKGSNFQFFLPLESRRPLECHLTVKQRHLVYLNSNNHVLRNAIAEQLRYYGIDCVFHYNFPKDISQYTKLSLLIDIEDRSENAEQALARCLTAVGLTEKKHDFTAIALIPNNSIGDIDKFTQQGFASVLRKPVRLDSLVTTIERSKRFINPLNKPSKSNETHAKVTDLSKPPLKILLVEDSPANQAVVKAILADNHCRITVANNGKEAVELANTEHFPVILMDLAMPVMNGIEATETIRKSSAYNQQSRIVAMTANAFAEDKKRCLEAGMDEYLSKPIDVNLFLERFDAWQQEPATHNKHAQEPEETQNTNLVNEATLQQLIKDTSVEVVPKLISIYIAETKNRLQLMKKFHSAGKWTELGDEAHTLKSSSGSFGATYLADKARRIELAVKEDKHHTAEIEMRYLEAIGDQSIKELTNFLDTLN